MKLETLAHLRCPTCGATPAYEGPGAKGRVRDGRLVCAGAGHVFTIRDGIPQFIGPTGLQGLNRKYAALYSWIAPFYDSHSFIASYVRRQFWPSGEERARREIIDRLEVNASDRVLETGIGTGANLPYLLRQAPDLQIYGLDIAPGMLRRCRRQVRRWGLDVELFLGNGEALPFADNGFDVVFHVGGINAFTDKEAAVQEMIRVARPGTLIAVADEMEDLATEARWISKAGLRLFFAGRCRWRSTASRRSRCRNLCLPR